MRKTLTLFQHKAHPIAFDFKKAKGYILPLTLLGFAVLMLIYPSHYLESAKKGFALFSSSVLPAIFPFAFLSMLLSKTNIINDISRAFEKPIKFFFGVSGHGAYVMFSSLICGYPAGAVTTYNLYSSNVISEDDAKSYIPFSSTASPVFILATVGGALFQDKQVGLVILISHYVGTFLNGVLWRFLRRKNANRKTSRQDNESSIKGAINPSRTHAHTHTHMLAHTHAPTQKNNNENMVGDAVMKSVSSMLAVGGYMVLMGLVVDTLHLLPFFDNSPAVLKSILSGLIEMSRGVAEARAVDSKWLAVALATFSVTFGGVSVNLQNYHYFSKCNCSFFDVILPKFSQGILAFFCAIFFSIIIFNNFGIKG